MKLDHSYFTRFGGLSLKSQKGYRTSNTFHSPPTSRGIYAFPIKAIELFLITGRYQEKDYEQMMKDGNKIFQHKGPLWHHLEKHVKPNKVIMRSKQWIKTSYKTWLKAFLKESAICRAKTKSDFGQYTCWPGLWGMFTKDHLEVFIDENI